MASQTVTLHDRSFDLYLHEKEILADIKTVATSLNADYANLSPIFVVILNGSFMFASDLLKEVTVPCEISFMKVSSYENTASTGQVKELLGLKEDIGGRHLVVLEDIVDTGNTVVKLLALLNEKRPASIEIATMLQKPGCLQHELSVKYIGREIQDDFVVGYGLDYNGLGRNLRNIYKVI